MTQDSASEQPDRSEMNVGNVSGQGIAIGHGAQSHVHQDQRIYGDQYNVAGDFHYYSSQSELPPASFAAPIPPRLPEDFVHRPREFEQLVHVGVNP